MVLTDIETLHLEEFVETLLRCNHLYHPSDDSIALRNAVESRRQIEIFDYSRFADAFTRAFGMRNSLKCLQALTHLRGTIHTYRSVCDLGCGSGAFSLAFAYLADNPELDLCGLDTSEHQLSLARELMAAARLPGRFRFERKDLPTQIGERPDLTISSFWFCENEQAIANPALFDLMVGRELLVVDYEKIVDRIATSLPKGFRILARHNTQVDVPTALTDFVAQERASVYSIHIGRTDA